MIGKDEIILANLILDKVKQQPQLDEYLKVCLTSMGPDELNLAELFYHMDVYYDRATVVKSAMNFLKEEVGVDKTNCVLLLCIEDDALYDSVVSVICQETETLLVARARTVAQSWPLLRYFMAEKLFCGLITQEVLDKRSCLPLLTKSAPLPCCVILDDPSTKSYLKFLDVENTSLVSKATVMAQEIAGYSLARFIRGVVINNA